MNDDTIVTEISCSRCLQFDSRHELIRAVGTVPTWQPHGSTPTGQEVCPQCQGTRVVRVFGPRTVPATVAAVTALSGYDSYESFRALIVGGVTKGILAVNRSQPNRYCPKYSPTPEEIAAHGLRDGIWLCRLDGGVPILEMLTDDGDTIFMPD